jgi:hypothetical protein
VFATVPAGANTKVLAISSAHRASVSAQGEPLWCGRVLHLRMSLQVTSPDLMLPAAQARLLSQLKPLLTAQCPVALMASALVERPGFPVTQYNATALGGWIFSASPVTETTEVVGRPEQTGVVQQPAGRMAPPAAPAPTPAPVLPPAPAPALPPAPGPALPPAPGPALPPAPGPALPPAPGPALPPAAAQALPPAARQAPQAAAAPQAAEPAPALEDPATAAARTATLQAVAGEPASVRLRNFIAAPAALADRKLDNIRDARAHALLSGQPVPVTLLIQAGGDGTREISTRWPGYATVTVSNGLPALKSNDWYLLQGSLRVPPGDDVPAAIVQARQIYACARSACADAAEPGAVARRQAAQP